MTNIYNEMKAAAGRRKERTGFAYGRLKRYPGKRYPYRSVKRGAKV